MTSSSLGNVDLGEILFTFQNIDEFPEVWVKFINDENKSKEIQGKNVLSFTKFVLGGFVRGIFDLGVYVRGFFVLIPEPLAS